MLPRPARLAALALITALPLSAAADPADLAAQKERLHKEVRELRALQAASSTGTTLLDEVGRALPELLWLEGMTFRAGQVQISGRAHNTSAVAQFIKNLDGAPVFDEPTLVDTAENPDDSYSFQLAFRFWPVPPDEGKASAAGLHAGIETLEQERDELSRRVARRQDVPRILDELRALAENLDLGSLSLVEARSGGPRTARVDVDLAATYHGLSLLFDRLKSLSAVTTLDELTIRQELSERGTISASFRLRIPLQAPE
jgi:hypothetical protein